MTKYDIVQSWNKRNPYHDNNKGWFLKIAFHSLNIVSPF